MMNFEDVQNIAYLGPQGSFSEMATDKFCEKYNIQAVPTPLTTIKQVVEYVDANPNTLGVLPVENSIEGTVTQSLDNLMFTKNPNIYILSEYIMPIHHCLLARTTEISSIANIISHPQALAQCQNFIYNEMPYHVNIIAAASTSEAARSLVNYNLTYAAIGSKKTADVYYLNVLRENINDDKTNRTRFVLIGDFETEPTEDDRTSLAFSTANKPGALLEVLKVFLENDINLSYIASRPSKQKFGDYIFIVNFDGHIKDPLMFKTIQQVREKTDFLRFLGSYSK